VVADAGAIRAQVAERSWGLELTGRDGERILAQHPSTGGEPSGTLGFRTAAGWQHATGVTGSRRDGDAYIATLQTTDPARAIEARLAPAGGFDRRGDVLRARFGGRRVTLTVTDEGCD
jgi:hypothetical protein